MNRHSEMGQMSIHDSVLEAIISVAIRQTPGIVGLIGHRLDSFIQKNDTRGVVLSEEESGLVVDVYVVVEYGSRIGQVAWQVSDHVGKALMEAVAVMPHRVVLHVEGVEKRENN